MKLEHVIPELLVEDVSKSCDFYVKVLGFKVEISFPPKNPVFVQVGKGNVHIMLYARSDFEKEIPKLKKVKMGGSILLYHKASGVQEFYQKIKSKVKIIQRLQKTAYGSWEFTIEDCNGYLIAFAEKI